MKNVGSKVSMHYLDSQKFTSKLHWAKDNLAMKNQIEGHVPNNSNRVVSESPILRTEQVIEVNCLSNT